MLLLPSRISQSCSVVDCGRSFDEWMEFLSSLSGNSYGGHLLCLSRIIPNCIALQPFSPCSGHFKALMYHDAFIILSSQPKPSWSECCSFSFYLKIDGYSVYPGEDSAPVLLNITYSTCQLQDTVEIQKHFRKDTTVGEMKVCDEL